VITADRFAAHCQARARQVAAGKLTLTRAADILQADAETSGLIETIGQDAVQGAIADAFQEARHDG
jgi:hypothetical protein